MKTTLILFSLFFSLSITAQSTSEDFLAAGIAKHNAKNFAGAIKDFNAALELNSNSIEAYYRRGKTKSMMRDPMGEMKDYSAILRVEAKTSTDHLYLGKTRIEMGHHSAAIIAYNKAIELDPKNSAAYVSRGEAAATKKNYLDAISDYNKALEIDPKSALAYYNRGTAYLSSEEQQKACSDFQSAMDLGSTEAASISAKKCSNNTSSPVKKQIEKEKDPVVAQQQTKQEKKPVSTPPQNDGSPAAALARQTGWSVTYMEKTFASDEWKETSVKKEYAYLKIEVIIDQINRMRALDPNYDYSEWLAKVDKCRTLYFAEVGYPKPDLFDFTKYTSVQAGKVSPFNYEGSAKSQLQKVRTELATTEKINQTEDKEGIYTGITLPEKIKKTESAIKKALAVEPNLDMTPLVKELEFYKAVQNAIEEKNKAEAKELERLRLEGLNRIYSPVEDRGITSSLHSKYMKKVVFSNREVSEKSPSETTLITSFKLGDPLFFRGFFDESAGNYCRRKFLASNFKDKSFALLDYTFAGVDHGKGIYNINEESNAHYIVKIFLDDQTFSQYEYTPNHSVASIDERTTESGCLMPPFKDFRRSILSNALCQLKAGSHKLRMELWTVVLDKPIVKMAEGQISFTCTEAELTNFRRTRGIIMDRETMTDETTKARMISGYKARYNHFPLLRLEITTDWTINRAFTGIILNRSRKAQVAYKSDNGFCYVSYVTFFQEHDGNKFESSTKVTEDSRLDSKKIDCRDVNY